MTVLLRRKCRGEDSSECVSIKLTALGDGFSYFPRISNFLLYDLTITISVRNTASLFVKLPSNFQCLIKKKRSDLILEIFEGIPGTRVQREHNDNDR